MKRGSKSDTDKLVKEIENKNEKQPVKILSPDDTDFLPTGSTLLNLVVGGGWPVSRIVNIVGDSSGGKTFLATEAIANALFELGRDKLEWFYDDAEERYSFNTQYLYGFDILEEDQENSYTIEDFEKSFKTKVNNTKKGNTFLYVLDSLDFLSSEAELKRDKKKENKKKDTEEKGTYNLEKQKTLGGFFRKRKVELRDQKCILFIVSQVRMNIGLSFGPKYYRTGGKALDHAASIIIWLAEVEKIKRKGRTTGVTIKVRSTKTSNDKPFRECYIDMVFDYGIDNIKSNIVFLYDMRTETGKLQASKKIDWDGEEYSLRMLIKHIEDNDLEEELERRVIDKWNEIEESISSKGRKSRW